MTNQRLKGISGLICLKFSLHRRLQCTQGANHTVYQRFHCCCYIGFCFHWNALGSRFGSSAAQRDTVDGGRKKLNHICALFLHLISGTRQPSPHLFYPHQWHLQTYCIVLTLCLFLTFNLRDSPTVSSSVLSSSNSHLTSPSDKGCFWRSHKSSDNIWLIAMLFC